MSTKRGTKGVPCPECGCALSLVADTRNMGEATWRRRECMNGHRYTTMERAEVMSHGPRRKTTLGGGREARGGVSGCNDSPTKNDTARSSPKNSRPAVDRIAMMKAALRRIEG